MKNTMMNRKRIRAREMKKIVFMMLLSFVSELKSENKDKHHNDEEN